VSGPLSVKNSTDLLLKINAKGSVMLMLCATSLGGKLSRAMEQTVSFIFIYFTSILGISHG
jgi:hypothetical protein